jgi:CBS domain-containing protein
MTTAQDIMHSGAKCIGEHESLQRAAQLMRELDVGSLPICGDDDRLHGIITDRDIVTKCVAAGADPARTTAGELARGTPVTVTSDADIRAVLQTMEKHQIKRLPVIDDHRLVGMISESDLARHLPERAVGEFAGAVYSASKPSRAEMAEEPVAGQFRGGAKGAWLFEQVGSSGHHGEVVIAG